MKIKHLKLLLYIIGLLIIISTFIYIALPSDNNDVEKHATLPEINSDESYRVLVLFSYDVTFASTNSKLEGISNVFSNYSNISYDVEFLDTKKLSTDEYFEKIKNTLKSKLSVKEDYDILMTIDDNALKFALMYQDELFSEMPIVFSGVNDPVFFEQASNLDNVIGYYEDVYFTETLDAALDINKDASEIIYITDASVTAESVYNEVINNNEHNLMFTPVSGEHYSFAEVKDILRNLEDDTIVIYSSFTKDKNGLVYDTKYVNEEFASVSTVPIYNLWYWFYGFMGGMVFNQRIETEYLSTLAIDVLNNNNSDEGLSVEQGLSAGFVFDKLVMDKYGIKDDKLPKDSIIINDNINYFKLNYNFAIVLIIITTGIMTFLFISENRISRKLRNNNIRLKINKKALVNQTNSFKYQLQIERTIKNVSTYFEENRNKEEIVNYVLNELCNIYDTSFLAYISIDNKKNIYLIESFVDNNNYEFVENELSYSFMNTPSIFKEKLNEGLAFNFDIDQIKDESFYNTFLNKNVHKFVVIPIKTKKLIDGFFILIDKNQNFMYKQIQLDGLNILSSTIENNIMKRRSENLLISERNGTDLILRYANVARWKYEIGSEYIYGNDVLFDILGLPKTENGCFRVDDVANVISKEDYHNYAQLSIEHIINELLLDNLELQLIHENKTVKWVNIRGYVTEQINGIPKAIGGVIIDITKIKESAMQMAKITNNLKNILELSEVATWEYDLKTKQLIIDDNLYKMLGYERGKSIDSWFNEITHESDGKYINNLVKETINGLHDEFDANCRYKKSDGEYIWLNVKGYLLNKYDERDIQLRGIFINVDDQKKMSEEIYSRNSEMEAVFKGIGFDLIKLDVVTGNLEVLLKSIFRNSDIRSVDDLINSNIHDDDKDIVTYSFANIYNTSDSTDFIYRITDCKESNKYTWVNVNLFTVEYFENGKPKTNYIVFKNIDAEKIATDNLKDREEKLSHIVNNSSNSVIELDYNNNIVFANDVFKNIVNEENIIGKSVQRFVHPDDSTYLLNSMANQNTNQIVKAIRVKTKNLKYRWYEFRIKQLHENNEYIGKICTGYDVNDRFEENKKTLYIINHDRLTGLYNVNFINDYLNNLEKNKFTVCIFINIDNFREINDTYGYNTGDEYLIQFANRLSYHNEESSIFSRISGDEFVILSHKQVNNTQLFMNIENQIKELCQEPLICFNVPLNLSLTVGYARYPNVTNDPSNILRFAEIAMKIAKNNVKGSVLRFDSKMYQEYEYIRKTTEEIRDANIANEFEMYYQPIIDINDNNIVIVEALMRWNHPKRGLLGPGNFIEVMEKSGQILNVELIMFEQVLNQIKTWNKNHNIQLIVSYNVSPISMKVKNKYMKYKQLLEEYNVDPKQIHIEITESMAYDDNENLVENICKIRELGIKIALDDFGIEYSTLSHLDKLEYDIIKIDKYFTQNSKYKIPNLILELIKKLVYTENKICIVEGVENEEQLTNIKKMGFSIIQGFKFYKPMKASEIDELLESK